MRFAPKMLSCLFVLLTSFAVVTPQVKADTKDHGQPEMVWLNYVQGEVKLSPGHNGEPKLGKDWIQANAGQVVEEGYTLVTENGRAEVEFEDGTMVYLAENSALEFDTLWSGPQTFSTYLDLLTGMATVGHSSPDEVDLRTPVTRFRFVGTQTARVECALDGAVIKTVQGVQRIATLRDVTANGWGESKGSALTLKDGESAAYVDGKLIPLLNPEEASEENEGSKLASATVRQQEFGATAASDDWDQWVAGRMAHREALIAEGMKESGLKEPIPGLAGMVENGRFFDCAPYGKCWEANPPAEERTAQSVAQTALAAPPVNENGQTAGTTRPNILVNQTMLSRCPMQAWGVAQNPSGNVQYGPCFAGSWNNAQWDPNDPCRYLNRRPNKVYYWPGCEVYSTWVVGRRHRHPCHFVRTHHHQIGIVPRHPADQRGHPPVNAKSGILTLAVEKGGLRAGMESAPSKGVQVVANMPSGFGRGLLENTPRVGQPVIQARMAAAIVPHELLGAQHLVAQKNVTGIQFDFKSQNFVGHSGSGGESHGVVVGHVGGGGGIGGSGGAHGGSGGSGSSSGGGGHSGGGASSGGASAGGGGGGHH
ncbi:MAG: FecR family protein [Candidatus Acidiferrum sp.]